MRKTIRLTEHDLIRIVKRVINEQENNNIDSFKSIGTRKLGPLGFKGRRGGSSEVQYVFEKARGSRDSYVDILFELTIGGLGVNVITGMGNFTKQNIPFNKLDSIISEVISINSLQFNSGQEDKIKRLLAGKGYKIS